MSERVLSPIRVAPSGRYFETFEEQPFLFIGFNDAISWLTLQGLYRRKDVASVEAYLQHLVANGVNTLRLMLDYAHFDTHLLENPVGVFNPHIVALWDDLLARCREYGLRVLLTPWDTFWLSRRWHKQPYCVENGGPAHTPQDVLTSEAMIQATIRRLHFVIERWGQDGAIAALDLHNEIHPHWGGTPQQQAATIARISEAVREKELSLYGFTRPQTVSVFGPDPGEGYDELIFRHPSLDFATTHIYSKGGIDKPRNTVTAAVAMAQWTRYGRERTLPTRPFTDSEHGPIHLFNDFKKTLPEAFDDEYERHMTWTHLACGGAGSGMRWPARHPHRLTEGMLKSLRSMASFTRLIAWRHFAPRDVAGDIQMQAKNTLAFGISDGLQAVVYLLRGKPTRNSPGLLKTCEATEPFPIALRNMTPGPYSIILWNTREGCAEGQLTATATENGVLQWTLPCMGNDLALAIRPRLSAD